MICGEWASEGCEHLNEETGKLKPEFEAEAERRMEEQRRADDAYAQEYLATKHMTWRDAG